MPLIHISLRAGKPAIYRQAIFDSLYQAMREALDVPEDDQFMTITEHEATNFRYGSAYGIARSADLVYIQITVFSTRTAEQKKALFERIAERLGENPGIRAEDVFVVVLDATNENWSVGLGLAQFA
jgi:4-oxalocrotonate tautomerase